MDSLIYDHYFGNIKAHEQYPHLITNNKDGYRLALVCGQAVCGYGYDVSVADFTCAADIDKVVDFYNTQLSVRVNNPDTAIQIVAVRPEHLDTFRKHTRKDWGVVED